MLILIPFLLFSCGKKHLEEAQLRAYVADPDNGLVKEKLAGTASIMVSYRPVDFMILQEVNGQAFFNHKVADSLKQSYAASSYFILNISKDNQSLEVNSAGNPHEYESLLAYLGGEISNDVWLASATDTIATTGHIYTNFYNTTAATTLLFAFENKKLKDAETLSFLFQGNKLGLGFQAFTFDSDDIKNIPALIF